MANLVVAAGVPHPPRLLREIEDSPEPIRAESLMLQVRQYIENASPDVIIEIDTDHFVNFFLDNMPTFCVGTADEAKGPQEIWCPMPYYTVKIDVALATGLLRFGLKSNFDLASAEELRLDHSMMVPLHFLNPGMAIPVVPFYINGFSSPTPTSQRCFAVGKMIRRFIDQWDDNTRVAVIASGCFAMDVGGPLRGWVDREWESTVAELLKLGKYQSIVRRATAARMQYAGNNSAELLNWIALTGVVGNNVPLYVETDEGSGYAVWDLDGSTK